VWRDGRQLKHSRPEEHTGRDTHRHTHSYGRKGRGRNGCCWCATNQHTHTCTRNECTRQYGVAELSTADWVGARWCRKRLGRENGGGENTEEKHTYVAPNIAFKIICLSVWHHCSVLTCEIKRDGAVSVSHLWTCPSTPTQRSTSENKHGTDTHITRGTRHGAYARGCHHWSVCIFAITTLDGLS